MRKLGNWTTLDCPTSRQDEALNFLTVELEKVGATVLLETNPHEMGEYPSFEIFIPAEINDYSEDNYTLSEEEHTAMFEKKEKLIEQLNEIEVAYYKKFKDVL